MPCLPQRQVSQAEFKNLYKELIFKQKGIPSGHSFKRSRFLLAPHFKVQINHYTGFFYKKLLLFAVIQCLLDLFGKK